MGSLEFQFKISSGTISRIAAEVCLLILEQLEPKCLRLPQAKKAGLKSLKTLKKDETFPVVLEPMTERIFLLNSQVQFRMPPSKLQRLR